MRSNAAHRWCSSLATLVRSYATAAGSSGGKRLGLADVQHVVAVASGKGGVGKSTVAVNLAAALAMHHGWRVGLLDADIHGPSLPTMMKLHGEPAVSPEGLMEPLENYRVKCMSMGFFMKGDAPVVWRGPIVNSAIDKFLLGTAWGSLNILVVDLPPGTGDAQIGLGQRLPLSGAVIVSTPQDVALLDARRGAQMFRKVHVPLLGLVENMSYYHCPKCGHQDDIFGSGGGVGAADDLGMELLGQVPLDTRVRVQSDAGVPVVVSHAASPPGQAYIQIASIIKQKLSSTPCSSLSQQPPTVTIS
eukprot:gene6002-6240_t